MKTKTIILVLIAFVGCIMLAQDAPRGFRNPADVVMMTSLVSTSSTPSTLTNGLVAYWGFEAANNITNDLVGTNNLTMVGTVDCSTNGIIGKAAWFTNNVANYFKIPNAASANVRLAGINKMTCSLWINSGQQPSGSRTIGQFSSTAANGWGSAFGATSSRALNFYCPTNGGLTSNVVTLATTSNLFGLWMHVVFVYNSTQIIIYTNGVSSVTNAMDGSNISDTTKDFGIGTAHSTTASVITGSIDDVAIWNTNKTSSEILSIYQAGTNGVGYPWTGY